MPTVKDLIDELTKSFKPDDHIAWIIFDASIVKDDGDKPKITDDVANKIIDSLHDCIPTDDIVTEVTELVGIMRVEETR